MTSSGWPITSIRRNGRRRSSARSSPIWRRRAKRSSADSAPGATNTATIGARQPASSSCAACVRRRSGQTPTAALRISCPVPDIGALAIPPKSYSVEDSQLLKDCAGVKAGEAFAGAFLRQDRSGRRGQHQAEGLRGGRHRRGAAARMEDLDRRGGRRLARHAARHQAALRSLCGTTALRDLGGGAVPAQRIGADLVPPAAAPGCSGPRRSRSARASMTR